MSRNFAGRLFETLGLCAGQPAIGFSPDHDHLYIDATQWASDGVVYFVAGDFSGLDFMVPNTLADGLRAAFILDAANLAISICQPPRRVRKISRQRYDTNAQ